MTISFDPKDMTYHREVVVGRVPISPAVSSGVGTGKSVAMSMSVTEEGIVGLILARGSRSGGTREDQEQLTEALKLLIQQRVWEEREACVKAAEGVVSSIHGNDHRYQQGRQDAVNAIRARTTREALDSLTGPILEDEND